MVSILMPAYNAEKFIGTSIESVLVQTYLSWELIIINDGSTDNTRSIAESYAERDSRVKVINQDNKKLAAARNTGIMHSKGDWIAFLDSDDLWVADKLEKQISASRKFPAAGIIYTDGWIFNNEDMENLTPYPTVTGKLICPKEMYKMEYFANYIPVLAVLVRRSLIEKIGYQDEDKAFYGGCEDWDYWLRMAIAGAYFYGVPEKLFYYRRHDNNMSGNKIGMLLAQTIAFIKNFDPNFLKKQRHH